jgi:hypothetical protein
MATTGTIPQIQPGTTEKWFDELVATIRTHELQLHSNTATSELKGFYNDLINKNMDAANKKSLELSAQYFISKMLLEYLSELRKGGRLPINLALQLSQNGINVWAIIEDDDDDAEHALYEAEARINAQFHKYGFRIDTTVLEKSDNFDIPSQFQQFPIHT